MMPEEPLLASNHLSSILLHLGSQEIRHLMSQELTENRDGGGMVYGLASCSRSPGQH